jgi:hypothetical protein
MSNLVQLRQLLQPKKTASEGKIIAIAPAGITASTRQGAKALKLSPGDITAYRIGDRIRFTGDLVTGRIVSTTEVYQR